MSVSNTYTFTVNTKNKVTQIVPQIYQNDNIIFKVTIQDGTAALPLKDSYTYYLASLRTDGNVVLHPGTQANGVLTFQLGPSEMLTPGRVRATIQIFDSDNTRVSSARFDYFVLTDPTPTV